MNNIYKLVAVIYQKSEMLSSLDISAFLLSVIQSIRISKIELSLNVKCLFGVSSEANLFPRSLSPFRSAKAQIKKRLWGESWAENDVLTYTRPSQMTGKSCKYILVLAYFHEGHTPLSVSFTDFFIPL